MADKVVKKPTYFQHIRHFFDETDLRHMKQKDIDLSTYPSLKQYATKVLFSTEPPNATMPDEKEKWSPERWQTFKNWILARPSHAIGTPNPVKPKTGKVERIRKDIDNLDDDELDLLKTAFEGLLSRDIDDPQSYFAIAGIHWYPDKSKCEHRVDKYHPWHRAYMLRFEDALRTVNGCENVTLPYWDITKPPPQIFFKAPFSSYTFPKDVSSNPNHKKGKKTVRNSRAVIWKNIQDLEIPQIIMDGLSKPIWNDFNDYQQRSVIAAHDNGHGAMGGSQFNSDVASFDPIFWFFHCNWDRLWWEWQQSMKATTYWTFRSTIMGSTDFLEPGLDDLDGFSLSVSETIDSHALGVGYEVSADPFITAFKKRNNGHVLANVPIRISEQESTSIRVKGIDRLRIPGGFETILKANGKTIGRRFFFQSSNPRECANCNKNGLVNMDFEVPMKSVLGKKLSVELHVMDTEEGLDTRFPLHSAGNPTINARILLHSE